MIKDDGAPFLAGRDFQSGFLKACDFFLGLFADAFSLLRRERFGFAFFKSVSRFYIGERDDEFAVAVDFTEHFFECRVVELRSVHVKLLKFCAQIFNCVNALFRDCPFCCDNLSGKREPRKFQSLRCDLLNLFLSTIAMSIKTKERSLTK